MPRIGSRINQNLGTFNPKNPGRQITPSLQRRGPALPQEFFTDPDLDPTTKRALLQIQNNVRQAFSQVKGSPFAYANIIQGWQLVQGGSNGATPNILKHGLGQPAAGAYVITTYGGFVTASAVIPNPPTSDLLQLWTQFTAFTGATVTADILVYA